jgi:hypothetical protein
MIKRRQLTTQNLGPLQRPSFDISYIVYIKIRDPYNDLYFELEQAMVTYGLTFHYNIRREIRNA